MEEEVGDVFDIDELETVDSDLVLKLSQEAEKIEEGGSTEDKAGRKKEDLDNPSGTGGQAVSSDIPQAGQSSGSEAAGEPTAPDGQPFLSYEEVLKQRIEARLEQETQEKAKTSHALRQALRDQEVARETIPVTVALIDYLGELKQALENNPEQFYCSLDLPVAAEVKKDEPVTTRSRRKGPVPKQE